MSEVIVVGTDGSPQAGQAVQWAADEAGRRGLALRIVHVVSRPAYLPSPRVMPGVLDSLVDSGHRILAEAEEAALWQRPGLPLTTVLVEAHTPSAGLREQAVDAAEVVVGHRGLGGFTGLVLGSTGLHTAGHLPMPVVIVRAAEPQVLPRHAGPPRHAKGTPVAETTPHGEIVAGVDLGADATPVLEYAFAAAAARDSRLRVVYAWRPVPSALSDGYVIDMEEVEVNFRDHLGVLLVPWRAADPRIEIIEEVLCDHPVHAMAELSHKADLLVVGHHPRGGPRLGSVGHGVIHHATCPVAVVPAHGTGARPEG